MIPIGTFFLFTGFSHSHIAKKCKKMQKMQNLKFIFLDMALSGVP
jgi:hypothetical protein